MSLKLRNCLFCLLVSITFVFVALGLLSVRVAKADDPYESPLPSGAYIDEYTVLDVNVGDLSGSTIKTTQAMDSARAVRFKLTATAANTWNTYFGLFTTTDYYHGAENKGNFNISFFRAYENRGDNRDYIVLELRSYNSVITSVNFDHPAWLDLKTANASFNFEIGGVPVKNASGSFIGTYFYMDVDNVRLVEYYYANSGLGFAGNNFNYEANQTTGSLTTSDLGAINASGSVVTIADGYYTDGKYDINDEPAPAVTLVTTKSGVDYGRVIAPQYYDVDYTDNDKVGTATATVNFKGKYSGSASATFGVTDVVADYSLPLPDGYYIGDYTVLDVAKEYGTEGVYTQTTTGEENIALSLKGASAYRFKFSQTGSPWSLRFGIFNTTQYLYPNNSCAYVDLRDQVLDILPNNNTLRFDWDFPVGTDRTTENVYEFGGLKVYNSSDIYIGRLFYLEINGIRVCEYFFNSADVNIFVNDNLTICNVFNSGVSSTVTLTSPDAEDLTGKTVMSVDINRSPMLIVKGVKVDNGRKYVQIIDEKYYDVDYQINDGGNSTTITLTFKDKYLGTASGVFDVQIVDANAAVVTLVKTCFTKNNDNSPITPQVVSVEKGGKAIAAKYYTVSYENNVNVGTGKVILKFKNGYFGETVALFRINPILTENHFIDANPAVLDLAQKYGDTNKRIVIDETGGTPDGFNVGHGIGGFFDMNDYDVVRFKTKITGEWYQTYFTLCCSNKYYVGDSYLALFGLCNQGKGKNNLELSLRSANGTPFKSFSADRPTEFDAGDAVNVEVGALKIYYNDDGDISFAGTLLYIELNGNRVLEYIYLNQYVSFDGGNFFIGASDAETIVIEPFDEESVSAVNNVYAMKSVTNDIGGQLNTIINGATESVDHTIEISVCLAVVSVGIIILYYIKKSILKKAG